MKQFEIGHIVEIISSLHHLEGVIKAKRKELGEVEVEEELRQGLTKQLAAVIEVCREVALVDCLSVVQECMTGVGTNNPEVTMGMVQNELRHARTGIVRELQKWKFVPVNADTVQYFEQDQLFGLDVFNAFEAARTDVREAGNCIAVELSSAAIFHLMRVAEHGLRAVAKRLRVRLTHSGNHQPIEYADWSKIITAAQNQIAAARKLSPGPKKQAKLELYADAADHCDFMKDIWRNNASHSRKPYAQFEAQGAFTRVRDFMQFVAAHMTNGS